MLRFDDFELDEANARLTRAGVPVQLPPKAFAVLCALARGPGKLTRKDELLDAVWGHRHVSESVLKSTVSQVRAALGDDASKPRYIETASRHGYRFIGPVAPAGSPSAAAATPAGTGLAQAAAALPAYLFADRPQRHASMVGRESALTVLQQAWRRANAGRRELVWIAGDPGVGKTTLIEAFAAEATQAAVTFGHCVEQFGAGEPYLPILEALGSLCRRYPEFPQMIRAIAPTVLVQMPWLSSPTEREELMRGLVGASADRMLRELTELTDRFTQVHPLILVTEDLHWADLATLRAMSHFARSHSPARLLWIGSYRLTQVIAEGHPLVALRQELRLHKLCTEIVLDSFSEAEVGKYLEQRLPQTGIPEAFARRLHGHTDGLPLFVANVVDTLLEQHTGESETLRTLLRESHPAPLPVPDNLIGALEKQIVRLAPETRAVLEAASACGVEFRASTAAQTLGRPVTAVIDGCEELVRNGYWLEHLGVIDLPDGTLDARYAFSHALYRHAFYQRLMATQRVRLHRAVAQSLANARATGVPVTPAELASHYERGQEFNAAIQHYAEAALSALGHFAPLEAASITEHALSLLPRCAEGMERMAAELDLFTHRAVALTLLHGAGSHQAQSALARVRELCDILPATPARAPALNGLGWTHFGRCEYVEAMAIARRLDELERAHPNPVLAVYACNLMGLCLAVRAEHDAARQWLERGISTCDSVGAALPLGAFLFDPGISMRLHLALPLLALGYVDQARAQIDSALALAERTPHPMTRMLGYWLSGMTYARLGDVERVAERGKALRRLFESTQLPQAEGTALWLSGWAEAHRAGGDPDAGYRSIIEGYELRQRQGLLAGATEALVYATEVLIIARRWSDASATVAEALRLAHERSEGLLIPELLLLKARIQHGLANTGAARDLLHESLMEAQRQGALYSELKALTALMELGGRDEDRHQLDAAYSRLREGFDTPLCSTVRALLGKPPLKGAN